MTHPSPLVVGLIPNSYITGGIERLLELTVEPLRARGVEQVVVKFREDHPNLHQFTDHGVPVYKLCENWKWVRHAIKPGPQVLARWNQIVAESGISLINGHHTWDAPVACSLSAGSGIPYVQMLHNMQEEWETLNRDWFSRVYRLLVKRAFRRSARMLCVSQAVLDHAATAFRVSRTKLFLHEPCRDPSTWATLSPDGVRDIDVVMLGRLAPQKNVLFSIDVLAEVAKRRPGFRAVLLGVGPQEAEVRAKVAALNLGANVELMGQQPLEVVYDVCNRTKVFYAPSFFEGLSMAAVEAMGFGCAAVVSAVPSFTKVFPNEPAVSFVPTDDVGKNVEALIMRLDSYTFVDREAFRQRFSVDVYCDKLRDHYQACARR